MHGRIYSCIEDDIDIVFDHQEEFGYSYYDTVNDSEEKKDFFDSYGEFGRTRADGIVFSKSKIDNRIDNYDFIDFEGDFFIKEDGTMIDAYNFLADIAEYGDLQFILKNIHDVKL